MKIPAEFEDIFWGVELTEREALFLSWITSWDDYTVQNMRTVVEKVRSALSTLQAENEKLRAELEQVKRERDAAIESIPHECDTCVYYTVSFNGCTPDYDCINPDGGCSNNYDRWQWRGPEEG